MRDFILIISVIAYMIGGYFFVAKAERIFHENFKGSDYDDKEMENKLTVQNKNKPLNKP